MTALLVACGNALPPVPLQSPLSTPTIPVPPTPVITAQPGVPTQTPIVLPTATLGGPAPQPTAGVTQPTAAVQPQPPPQVVEPTVQLPPSATPLPSPTIDLTAVFGPQVTPNTKATSFAVILTITALSASPTYPPTSTPRPRRQPIIIGAGGGTQDRLPATTEPRKSGIKVQTVSPQVSPGGPAALSILTAPDTICSLQIARALADGKVEFEPIAGTARQSAGRDGGVAWIWTVDADEPAGQLLLVIDCGTAGVQQLQLNVIE